MVDDSWERIELENREERITGNKDEYEYIPGFQVIPNPNEISDVLDISTDELQFFHSHFPGDIKDAEKLYHRIKNYVEEISKNYSETDKLLASPNQIAKDVLFSICNSGYEGQDYQKYIRNVILQVNNALKSMDVVVKWSSEDRQKYFTACIIDNEVKKDSRRNIAVPKREYQ